MKKRILITFFVFISNFINSQFHEAGIFLGGSNYIGEIGSDYYILPTNPAFGLIYKWNINTRYSLRASVITTSLKASDYRTNDINRFGRAYSFENNLTEASLGIEFNFVDFNLHNQELNFTPYLFLGLNYINYDKFYFDSSLIPISKPITRDEQDQSFSIPLILGFKINPNPFFVIGLEIGAKYALTDNLDGSDQGKNDSLNQYSYGNKNNNDWYIFSGITISFTFGDLACYSRE